MIKTVFVAASLLVAGNAFADEVIIHRDAGVPAPVSSTTSVEHRSSSDGCASKTVRKENDLGDTKTVTKTDCE